MTMMVMMRMMIQVQEMEWDKKDLERQLNELKLKFEQAERAAAEQRQVDEKKHGEEIQFLKRTNQQLKVATSVIYVADNETRERKSLASRARELETRSEMILGTRTERNKNCTMSQKPGPLRYV